VSDGLTITPMEHPHVPTQGRVARRDDRQLPLFDAMRREPDFEVRLSRRARRLTVRVYPGGRVEVTVPFGTRAEAVERFVATHRVWIDQRVADFRLRTPPALQPLPDHVHLRALGEEWHVRYEPKLRGGWRNEAPGHVVIGGDASRPAEPRERLREWLVDQGYRGLAPWLGRVAAERGFAFERAQIRRQRTRWGSCSRRGTISLNVCLLFQPPPVVEYLFVHELAHTRHMNHSERFWRLVGEHAPDWRALDRELLKGWKHVPDWVYA
jgi:predicted metal-dependent hydrolase